MPIEERLRHSKDLGEVMVIAHAVVAAEAGDTMVVLIDDGAGTLTVLVRAAGGKYVPDKAAMRDIYSRLRGLDDGLPPISATNLLTADVWTA